ncbi:MAG: VWA domain-containing protein [Candidatus Omnitrophica bacterium]|nr:VWA domain-containing protein [Candidatus Omnitrophota bacterium]
MQFLYPEWLNGFWLLIAVLVFFVWTARRKQKLLSQFADSETAQFLTRSHSRGKERFKQGLVLMALSLLVLTLAQPQWGEIKKEIKRQGVEIIFLVDTSLSMLAEDVPPSRIEKAKLELKSFLRSLKGDRIGIVTFAGSGFIQSPLTLDYDAFLLFANSIRVGYIPDAGTSLSEAIRSAIKAFPESKQKNHVMILLSDGEDLEGNTDAAITMAQEANIRIYAIGIGTQDGAPIPLRSENKKISGYKKDRSGEVVITKLNEDLLKQISDKTGGLYIQASPSGREIDWIYQHTQNLEKKEFKQRLVVERENHYQFFLAFAVFLLLLEMLMNPTKQMEKSHV